MMAADRRRLDTAERAWFDRNGEPINIERAWQESDRRIAMSRRQRALLAAAGESGPAARWYILQVKRGADIAVDKLLEEARIEHWIAQETKVVRRRGRYGMCRPKAMTVPFLPGYIFIKVIWCAPCWEAIAGLKGVVGMIGGAERPSQVPEDKLRKLQAFVQHDPEAIRAMLRKFNPGDKVSVDDGPFASFPGEVVDVDDRGRAVIEVMLFGRPVRTDLSIAQISKSY
jgi:transcription antitermination factor NusG